MSFVLFGRIVYIPFANGSKILFKKLRIRRSSMVVNCLKLVAESHLWLNRQATVLVVYFKSLMRRQQQRQQQQARSNHFCFWHHINFNLINHLWSPCFNSISTFIALVCAGASFNVECTFSADTSESFGINKIIMQ